LRNRTKTHGDTYKFILMTLLKKGPLNFNQLEEQLTKFVNQFLFLGYSIIPAKIWLFENEHKRRDNKQKEDFNLAIECKDLIQKGKIILNSEEKYTLTAKGKEEAIEITQHLKRSANRLEKNVLNPSAAAKNTVVIDLLLAIIKLFSGFLSGSMGLIADGADAAIDTASAMVVWLGIKYKKEFLGTLIIIIMMFITAGSVGYESVAKIIQFFYGIVEPMSMPYLVIIVEGIALVFAVLLYFYQRFIGKRNGSLALISQSIDSKNHIYVAFIIIIGAIFSIFGIHFIDALIGIFVAIRIFIDGIALSKEALWSIKGEETDFSKYGIPLEKHWHLSKIEAFRIWILYSIKKENLTSKEEIIHALEETYQPEYMPILSEFNMNLGKGFDFKEKIDDLIRPLLEKNWLVQKDNKLLLTQNGLEHMSRIFKNLRFHQNE